MTLRVVFCVLNGAHKRVDVLSGSGKTMCMKGFPRSGGRMKPPIAKESPLLDSFDNKNS